jgi:hypothetical protein
LFGSLLESHRQLRQQQASVGLTKFVDAQRLIPFSNHTVFDEKIACAKQFPTTIFCILFASIARQSARTFLRE